MSSCTKGVKLLLIDDTNLSLLKREILAFAFPSSSTAVDDASFTSPSPEWQLRAPTSLGQMSVVLQDLYLRSSLPEEPKSL